MNTSTNLRKNFNVRGITLVGMPKNRGKFPGVYMIGNIYIGASSYILSRIKSHYNAYLRDKAGKYRSKDCDIKIYNYFKTCESMNIKPRVYLLSDDPFKEKYFKEEMGIPIKTYEKLYHQIYK